MTEQTREQKIQTLSRLYDAGASLSTIVYEVGTDEESLRLIRSRLGTGWMRLRREAAYVTTPPAPCGHCRRCAIHDDPGGCLIVEQWERDFPRSSERAQIAETVETHPVFAAFSSETRARIIETERQRQELIAREQRNVADYLDFHARRDEQLHGLGEIDGDGA